MPARAHTRARWWVRHPSPAVACGYGHPALQRQLASAPGHREGHKCEGDLVLDQGRWGGSRLAYHLRCFAWVIIAPHLSVDLTCGLDAGVDPRTSQGGIRVTSVLCVYVGRPDESRANLDFALQHGVWAFKDRHGRALQARGEADYVVIATTDADGDPTGAARWSAGDVVLRFGSYAGITVGSSDLVFPDEVNKNRSIYPHKFYFDLLGSVTIADLSSTPLPTGLSEGLLKSAQRRTAPVYADCDQVDLDALLSQARAPGTTAVTAAAVPPSNAGTGTASSSSSRRVPLEASNIDVFVRQHSGEPQIAVRAEAALVMAYSEWLTKQHPTHSGEVAYRHEVLVGSTRLFTDLYDSVRQELVETKADTRRNSIRTAVGQLLDYRRHVSSEAQALLVPSKPESDLVDFLKNVEIGCIYRDGSSFKRT